MYVRMCACASGVATAGVVQHTLVEPEGCLPDATSIRAYPCDIVLSDVFVNPSGKTVTQIPQLPLGDNSSPWGDNAVCT
jgi:hypothetical protein